MSNGGKDEEEFGDFTLKFVADLTDSRKMNEGYWICQCGSLINREVVTREVVLPTSAFDSKHRFLNILRQEFQGGTFSLFANCTNRFVTEFYRYLKRDYEAGEQGHCTLLAHIGYQSRGYWCLSDEIQIKDGILVSNENRKYRCAGKNELNLFSNTLNTNLLAEGYLSDIIRSFVTLADCWGCNKEAFLAASAFVCLQLMRQGDADENAGQANLGMIFSPDKSVGKSLTAKMLAYAQGVPGIKHNQLLAGGDQVMSGVSSKKLLEALTKTTFVVVVDDVKMTDTLTEFLLQVQGGLLQGSAQLGIDCPLGSILLTSNVKENERLNGRVVHFVYNKDNEYSATKELALTQLMDLICRNRGFLTVWAIKYMDFFYSVADEGGVLGTLVDILLSTIGGQQARWYKGIASVLLVNAMLCMSCGMLDEDQLVNLVTRYICHYRKVTASESVQSVIYKLEDTITKECQEEHNRDKVKTWLNCSVKVNQNGKMVPGLGIKSSKLGDWHHIGRKELAEEANKHGQSVVNISVPFAPTMPNENKNKKGLKFPKNIFSQTMVNLVEYVCGEAEKLVECAAEADQDNGAAVEICPLDNLQINTVKAVFTSLACDLPILRMCDIPDTASEENNYSPETAMELTPKTRRTVDSFTPKRKEAFEMGYLSGAKRRFRVEDLDENVEPGVGVVDSDEKDMLTHHSEPEVASTEKETRDDLTGGCSGTEIDARLSISGSIGFRRAKNAEEDDSVCKLCAMSSPPGNTKKGAKGKRRKSKEIDWVQCDGCEAWFHVSCSGLSGKPSESAKWHCVNCVNCQECSPMPK